MYKLFITVLLTVACSAVNLRTIPNIGDANKALKERPEQRTSTNVVLPEKKQRTKGSETIYVKGFKIHDNTIIKTKDIQEAIKGYNDKNLSITELHNVTDIITRMYNKRNYNVINVYLPVQHNISHIIDINVIEGKYDKLSINNKSDMKDETVKKYTKNLKSTDIISGDKLERVLLNINDTPGIKVHNAIISEGSKVGTSNLLINTVKTNKIDGYAFADNYGSRYTGHNRLLVGFDVNSPLGIGDQLSFDGLITNNAGIQSGRLGYSIPLLYNGGRVAVSYTKTTYKLSDMYTVLDAKGNAETLDMTFSYPLMRTKLSNLRTSLKFSDMDLEDEISLIKSDSRRNIKAIVADLDYDKIFRNTYTNIDFYYTYGNLVIDNPEYDAKTVNNNGSFSKINLDLKEDLAFTPKWSLENTLRMQYALNHKNLDASEDLSIGGAYAVKLYPDSELSAEDGYIFNTELKYKLPRYKKLSSTIGLFYDRGRVYMANNTVKFKAESIQDVGLGYYTNIGKFYSKLQVAWNANSAKPTAENIGNSRVLFSLGIVY